MSESEIIEVFPKKFDKERFEAQLDLFVKALITVAEEEVRREKEEAERKKPKQLSLGFNT